MTLIIKFVVSFNVIASVIDRCQKLGDLKLKLEQVFDRWVGKGDSFLHKYLLEVLLEDETNI